MTVSRTSIPGEDAEIAARHLHEVLADLVDLALQAKQAHWNVIGPRFRALHLQLDQIVTHTRAYTDTTAERIVTLGQPAVGAPGATDAMSKLDPLPADFLRDTEVVEAFVERLDGICGRIRAHLGPVRERDPVSEGLLVSILGTLEEQMWMLHAQAL